MKQTITIFLLVFSIVVAHNTFAQTNDVVEDQTITEAPEEDTEELEDQDESDDTTEAEEVAEEDTTETYNDEVEVNEEEISGEVIEITDQTIVIETADGEIVEISRGGGAILSPFVRQANLGELKVGDEVSVTVAQEVTITGEVQGVSENGSLTVTTSDGETRTIQPGALGVTVRQNGRVISDFSQLQPGDDVEIVYEGELISDVDVSDANSGGGWVVPVIVILIVLGLAGLLAKRNRR